MRLDHTGQYGMAVGLSADWPDPDPDLVLSDPSPFVPGPSILGIRRRGK